MCIRDRVKDWLKKRKRDMRREFSVFLVLVLALTGIPFPVRAGKDVYKRQAEIFFILA